MSTAPEPTPHPHEHSAQADGGARHRLVPHRRRRLRKRVRRAARECLDAACSCTPDPDCDLDCVPDCGCDFCLLDLFVVDLLNLAVTLVVLPLIRPTRREAATAALVEQVMPVPGDASRSTRAALALLRGYKRHWSHRMPTNCRFVPTCSEYAARAIAVHGLRAGIALARARLHRCRPGGARGADPVPPRLG